MLKYRYAHIYIIVIFFIFVLLTESALFKFASAGTLSCSITTAAACANTVIWRMSGATNAHAELPSQATVAYDNNVVCCGGVTGLGNSCADVFAVALKLSGVTNAHVEQNSQVNYANDVCVQAPSGGSVSVGYQETDCVGFDTTLGSMSSATNAHVGNTTAFTTKICATATATQTLTFSLGANSLSLETLSAAAVATSSHTIMVGTNAANGVAVSYSGATLTSGVNIITACSINCASAVDSEQFGINAVVNTSPSVGAACSGTTPIASAAANYDVANSFRFVSGDTIISSAGSINDTSCAISYIANIAATTEVGSYNTNLTFIATANF